MDFLIAFYLSYKLHQLAMQKEEPSAVWVIRFIVGWLASVFLLVFLALRQYGENIMQNLEALLILAILSLLLQAVIYLFIRNRQLPDPVEPENETIDVSYFR